MYRAFQLFYKESKLLKPTQLINYAIIECFLSKNGKKAIILLMFENLSLSHNNIKIYISLLHYHSH